MKNIHVTCVGKLKEKFFTDAVAEYVKRASKFCKLTITELADIDAPDSVRRESDLILATFKQGEYRILCDIGGDLVSSEQFSDFVENAFTQGYGCVRFIIGGSCGVDDRVRARADKRISFGRVTYPHRLMRVILLEQIYRGLSISAGLPYHK